MKSQIHGIFIGIGIAKLILERLEIFFLKLHTPLPLIRISEKSDTSIQ